jgi:hypothetical protein
MTTVSRTDVVRSLPVEYVVTQLPAEPSTDRPQLVDDARHPLGVQVDLGITIRSGTHQADPQMRGRVTAVDTVTAALARDQEPPQFAGRRCNRGVEGCPRVLPPTDSCAEPGLHAGDRERTVE